MYFLFYLFVYYDNDFIGVRKKNRNLGFFGKKLLVMFTCNNYKEDINREKPTRAILVNISHLIHVQLGINKKRKFLYFKIKVCPG